MARATFTDFTNRINRMLGGKGLTTEAGEALNQAYFQVALRNRDLGSIDLEVNPPYFFQTSATATTGTNTADASEVILGIASTAAMVGQLFRFSGEPMVYRIYDIDSGAGSVFVSPKVATAHAAAACAIVTQRFPLPDGTGSFAYDTGGTPQIYPELFYIIDVTDTQQRWRTKQVDVRKIDRVAPRVDTNMVWYYRSGNNLIIHPAPDESGIVFQVRYVRRPEEKSGSDTFAPLPWEFDRVVLYEAMSYMADLESEVERADYFRNRANEIEMQVRSKRGDELEDAEIQMYPRLEYDSNDTGGW